MPNCTAIDPLVTPYVDGEIGAPDRILVDEHLRRCPPCHARVAAERAVRELMRAKRSEFAADTAPPSLRKRCASLCAEGSDRDHGRGRKSATSDVRSSIGHRGSPWLVRRNVFALAAVLVLLVGGVSVYELTDRSTRLLAAELTADHVKCFGLLNPLLGTHESSESVEQSLATRFGWQVQLQASAERSGLELIGARPCLYAHGIVAHIMYRHHGQPVSLFMLPKTTHAEEMVDVMGHEASVWSTGGRTYVLIAREPPVEVTRLTSVIQADFR